MLPLHGHRLLADTYTVEPYPSAPLFVFHSLAVSIDTPQYTYKPIVLDYMRAIRLSFVISHPTFYSAIYHTMRCSNSTCNTIKLISESFDIVHSICYY